MGLLDNPQDAGLMQLGLGLLSASGPSRMPVSLGQALGGAGGQAMDAYRQAQVLQAQQKLQELQAQHLGLQNRQGQMQMEELMRKRAQDQRIRELAQGAFMSPQQQAIGAAGPTPGAAAMIPNLQPKFDQQTFLNGLFKEDPLAAMEWQKANTKQPYKLGAEETLYDPNTHQPIATGKGKNELKEGYLVPDGQGSWKIDPVLYKAHLEAKRAGAANMKTVVNPAMDPFKNEKALRDEYQGMPQVKAASEMNTAFKMIDEAYKRPSAANDLAMATKYMKILDPTSVVRESEFALAVNATGVLDKVQNYAKQIATGQRLNPNQRKDFYDSAKAINDAFQAEARRVGGRYKGIAGQYGLKPENITFGTEFDSSGVVDFRSLK